MGEYTYKNLIIDPTSEEAKTCIGKRVYYSSNPASCLQYANDHDMDCCKVLKGINLDDIYPFILEDNNIFCSCIIPCEEEPEPEYVPFESVEEFVERYMEVKRGVKSNSFEDNLLQCGMGLKERGREYDVFCLVTELWDYGVVIGEEKMVIRENSVYNNTTSWRELYDKYVFIDGSPCGKLRKNK